MCLGLPMRITATDGMTAVVEGRGERRTVSLLLVGEQPVGTPLLVHTGNAIRVLDEQELPLLEQALDGLDAAIAGQPIDAFFADLINREPQLPEHLRPLSPQRRGEGQGEGPSRPGPQAPHPDPLPGVAGRGRLDTP